MIQELQTALVALTQDITGLQGFDYAPETLTPPSFFVPLPTVDWDLTMQRGFDHYQFDLHVLVGTQLDSAANTALAEFLDPTGDRSIRQSIEATRRTATGGKCLGGLADDLHVVGFRRTTLEDIGGFSGVGGIWTVDVYATGV